MRISIIIPMYNESRYIARCLKSLKNQSYMDFEIILIDDGSKDDTVKIAKTFEKDFSLTILHQEHWWPGKARNRWAKIAKWDVFVFVDADMYFDQAYIENLVRPILKWEEEWTAHGTEKIWNPENIRAKSRSIDRIPNPGKRSGVYRAISKDSFKKSWGYNNDRFAFEDNIWAKYWKWALTVMNAICYHNNPENLSEVFKHDQWIWESMMAKWKIKEYISKYRLYLILITIMLVAVVYFIIVKDISWIWIIVGLWWAIIAFAEIIALKRVIKEKEFKYIFSIPILSITRWLWYISWATKHLVSKIIH